jgi:hypothetical protein
VDDRDGQQAEQAAADEEADDQQAGVGAVGEVAADRGADGTARISSIRTAPAARKTRAAASGWGSARGSPGDMDATLGKRTDRT